MAQTKPTVRKSEAQRLAVTWRLLGYVLPTSDNAIMRVRSYRTLYVDAQGYPPFHSMDGEPLVYRAAKTLCGIYDYKDECERWEWANDQGD